MRRLLAITFMILISAALASSARAQEDYRFDIGGGIGMTGYLGDANTANLLQNPSWDAELLFHYFISPRLALKTNFFVGGLRGNSEQMTNVFPNNANYKFTTTFYELSELFEFNFFNYGMGETYRKLKRITPYITAGLGMLGWTTGGHGGFSVVIPMGVGVKYKPAQRWNLGLEFLMKKTFSDKVDGPMLSDPIGIKSSFMKNTDWYSTLTFTVSYEFSQRCAVCNYKE